MRSPVILIVACVVVLAGAYFASRMLVSDVPAPSGPPPLLVTREAVVPVELLPPAPAAPFAARPAVNREEAQRAMLAPRQGPLQAVNVQQPVAHAVEPAPPAEVAPSPFQGESKELDYTEALLAEPNPPLERLQSAHQVLSRCLAQEPDNKRCLAAMTIAQNRLGAQAATERQPPAPTLQLKAPQAPAPK